MPAAEKEIPVPVVDPGVHKGPIGPGALSSLQSFMIDPTSPAPSSNPKPGAQPKKLVRNDVKISDKSYGRAEPPPPMGDYDKPEEAQEPDPEPEHLKKQRERQEAHSVQDIDSALDDFIDEHGTNDDGTKIEKNAEAEEGSKVENAEVQNETDGEPETPATDDEIAQKVKSFGKGPEKLRQAFQASLKRESEWIREKSELKAKLKEHETNLQAFKTGAEASEAHKAKVAELERIAAEREERIRILDYTKSGEFSEKYQKPLEKALNNAYSDIAKMEVQMEDGQVRRATEDDFQALVKIENPAKAGEMAERLFGKYGASEAMSHRRVVKELFQARREAIDNAATESKAIMERQSAEAVQRQQQTLARFGKEKLSILNGQFKPLLGEREGDDEGNNMLRQNLSRFEQLISGGNTDPEAQVKIAAEIHVMASALPRALRDIKNLKAELAAAQKQLKGYGRSEPRGGERTTTGPLKTRNESPMEAAFAGIDALEGTNR